MKNLYKVLIVLICAGILYWVMYNDCHYTRQGYIIHTCFDNYVVFVDNTGNEWNIFTDGKSFVDGQNVKVKMFDNYTPTYIQDDKCISVKYI